MNILPRIKLSNGVEMPATGQGTYPMTGDVLYNAMRCAVDCGCTLFDSAHSYPNESSIGDSLRRIYASTDLRRHDMFLISKIGDRLDNGMPMGYYFYNSPSCPNRDHRRSVFAQVEESLANLRTDYIDLLLIHWPYNDCLEEIWQAMEELYARGTVRAIGVSNHRERHLRRIMASASVRPMVNQIYISPLNTQRATIEFCRAEDIVPQAYSPLMFLRGGGRFASSPEIAAICGKYGKSLQQIVLRWDYQRGVATIPKSAGERHIRANYDIFDFTLQPDEMTLIESFNEDYQYLPESVYCPGY